MKLRLNRHASGLTCTIGDLYIDGAHFCHVLEDIVRPEKIAGETAIPAGAYRIDVTYSPRFKTNLPLLRNVPGFEGVRIHAGNNDKNTEGCLLVGQWAGGEFITNSRATLAALLERMDEAAEPMEIEIVNHEDTNE